MITNELDKLFNPSSIAVIGASRHPQKLGYQILENLINGGTKAKIFPVNPEPGPILNLASFLKVTDIPGPVDLAIIIVPAAIVPQVLSECVKKQVANAVIISAGFAEMGPKGKELQDKLQEIIKSSSTRVLGPNCLGIFNVDSNLNATFAAPKLSPGDVSVVFQSGALGVALLDWAKKYGFGFAKFVSLGNKVDLEESEIIDYLTNDPATKIIVLYLEEIRNPQKFLEVCRRATEKKPVIILKGGTTNLGAKAAFSHTAAMVGSEHTTKAIFAQANLIVARTIEDMLNIIQVLSSEPQIWSRRLMIITNAGGPGILATDMAARTKMILPELDEQIAKKLQKTLPKVASIHNPLDLTGEAKAQDYDLALAEAVKNDQVSSILTILTPQTATEVDETAEVLAKYSTSPKTIVASFLGDQSVASALEILQRSCVPHFEDPELAVFALSKITNYWQNVWRKKYLVEIEPHPGDSTKLADPLSLIQNYNIPIPVFGYATNFEVAYQIVTRIGFPVAVKNVGTFGEHKAQAGKVKLNIFDKVSLEQAIRQVQFPVLIQRMVEFPFEVIIGAKRDPNLGIILTFGWGGVYVEDLDDLAARILPLTEADLDEMIKETKIGQILVRENADLSGIKNILVAVAQIMSDYSQISEIDLNPIKVSREQAICVDARYNTIK